MLPANTVPGFISLLYGFGTDVAVSMAELRTLLAGSRGTVILARRLVGTELQLFEQYRRDSDAEVHGTIVKREELRFLRSVRGGRRAR